MTTVTVSSIDERPLLSASSLQKINESPAHLFWSNSDLSQYTVRELNLMEKLDWDMG